MSIRIHTYCFLFFSFLFISLKAQNSVDYRLEALGTFASGDYTPFWITSYSYGKVPLQNNSGYLEAEAVWKYSFSKDWKLEAGIDVIGATQHVSSVWLQQLYTDISFQKVRLTIGSKERYNSMLDKRLSVGDLNYSSNARPIPEINFSFPEYTIIPFTKDIVKFKADFAIGKSFENDYILDKKQISYDLDVLWHHKSLSFLLEDPKERFPLTLMLGLNHAVQWGGWTTYNNFGDIPKSLKDFMRIILGKEGGSSAIAGDQINALGNHQGTYNLKIAYKHNLFEAAVYKQHLFDDHSGMEYANWRDGIWGTEIRFLQQTYLKKIVVEYLQTTNQSGPMHFIQYDGDRYFRGGGNDDYYNHDFYYSGWSYFGRGLGNALLSSPEYNEDNAIHFKNNRVKAIHLGMEGNITSEIAYRTLFTGMQAWGRMSVPFLKRKDNFSALLECNYNPAKLKDWYFGLQVALDTGELYGDNFGVSLKVVRKGLLLF